MAITPEEKILALSLKIPLSEEDKNHIQRLLAQGVNWEALIKLAKSCGVLPLMAKNLLSVESDLAPKVTLKNMYEFHQREYTLNSLVLWSELSKIIKITGEKKIPAIPIKGVVLTEMLYDNPGLRRTSDIDILIKKEHLPEIEAELVNYGYTLAPDTFKDRKLQLKYLFHFSFKKKDPMGKTLFLELHWDVLPYPMRISSLIEDFWNNASLRNISGERILTLSLEDTLFLAIIELYKDITGYTPFLLKRYLDISQILHIYGHQINWDEFAKRTNAYGLRNLSYFLRIPASFKPSLTKRLIISRVTDKFNLPEKASLPRKFIFKFVIPEMILFTNRWKVLFIRLLCRIFSEEYVYHKIEDFKGAHIN